MKITIQTTRFKTCLFPFILLSFLTLKSSTIEKNIGQFDCWKSHSSQPLFVGHSKGLEILFFETKIAFIQLTSSKEIVSQKDSQMKVSGYRFDMCFPSYKETKLKTFVSAIDTIRYYKGHRYFAVPCFNKIVYDLDQNTSVYFYFREDGSLKYDIAIKHPEANFNFDMQYIGAELKVGVNTEELFITTPLGSMKQYIPLCYLEGRNKKGVWKREVIKHELEVQNKQSLAISFNALPDCEVLIIDPWISFVGGVGSDEGYGVDTDNNGNIYVSGFTSSSDFPSTPGVLQQNLNAFYDAFLFKFNALGQRLWATYYGGSQNDFGYKVKVNHLNKPVIMGYTYSSDLPVSPSGVHSSILNGTIDGFVAQFNQNGLMDWATFIGGSNGDIAVSMDIDRSTGDIALGGYTSSTDFPMINAWQGTFGGALDCFLVKMTPAGNISWSTYIGGNNSEDTHITRFDKLGNIIISGDSYSNNLTTSPGCYQNFSNGGSEMYLAKFSPSGGLLFSTYFGSSGDEDCEGLAVDYANNIYFTGYSTSTDLPVNTGAFQPTMNGVRDAIVGKFSSSGNFQWLTYAGGSAWDFGKAIEVDSSNKVKVSGETESLNFPVSPNAFQLANAGLNDLFYLELDTSGTVTKSSYLGGGSSETPHYMSRFKDNDVIIVGTTGSSNFPVTNGVFQTSFGGDTDAFIWCVTDTSFFAVGKSEVSKTASLPDCYPNPSNGNIFICSGPGIYHCIISDLSGRVIIEKEITSTEACFYLDNAGKLNSGIYILTIFKSKEKFQSKLVIH